MASPFSKKKEKEDDEDFLKDIKEHVETSDDEPVPVEPIEDEDIPPEIVPDEPIVYQKRKVKIRHKKPTTTLSKKIKDEEKTDKIKQRIKTSRYRKPIDWNRALLYLSVLGILGIIFLYQMVVDVSMPMAWVLMLFGMLCFLPLGLLLGKLFLDPYIRCKIYRRMRGKNYGMVYFVHKGGQRVDIRIKNLDDDVVVHETKIWVLQKGGIYYLDRDDSMVLHTVIEPANVVTSPNNVPILFLDPESMLPLQFYEPKTVSNPQQVGATVLGYINNQIAKNLFFKRSMQTFYTIILALESLSIVIGLMIYDLLGGFN